MVTRKITDAGRETRCSERSSASTYVSLPLAEPARASSACEPLCRKAASGVDHRGDLHNLALTHESVDHSVVADDQLAYIRAVEFWHLAPRLGELRQPLDSANETGHQIGRVARRVTGDVVADRLGVGQRRGRPNHARRRARRVHSPRSRRRASSCDTTSPWSAAARPRSTLARKYRRSMASSYVASAGSRSMASRAFCFGVAVGVI